MNNLQVRQGPIFDDVLFMGDDHRASQVFVRGDEFIFPMNVRRGDGKVWEFIGGNNINDNVLQLLNDAGFGGVIDCRPRNVDHSLIHALVERWRPETHTFHLPVGELTVTLQDVNVLLGLPVEGRVVSGHDARYSKEQHIIRCHNFFGYAPEPSHIRGGMLLLSSIYAQLGEQLPPDASHEQCVQRARMIIMCLMGGLLFADKSDGVVPLIFLSNLEDLSLCGQFSWGSAVLACLYRNLCKAACKGANEISGPVFLLQLWAWERLRCFTPRCTVQYDFTTSFGSRWRDSLSMYDTSTHTLRAYRSQLQSIHEGLVNWTPYDEYLNHLPAICTNGVASWRSRCYIIFWDVVESHHPERVLRQFGIVQGIPRGVLMSRAEHETLHSLNRQGRRNADWLLRHARYIASWQNRQQEIVDGQRVAAPTVSDDYMQWYINHTVMYVSNPGLSVREVTGFQNTGAGFQLMMDGFTHVYQSTQQYVESHPEAAPHFTNIQDTMSQVMGIANHRHRLDLPSFLTSQAVPQYADVAPQRVQRSRGRRLFNRIFGVDLVPPVPQNRQQGETSGVQQSNFEVGSSSRTPCQNFGEAETSPNMPDMNMINWDTGYHPSTDLQSSPNPSFFEGLGTGPSQDYTPTPPPYVSNDDSGLNLFAGNPSFLDPGRHSDVTPINFNLFDDASTSEEQNDGNRRQRRGSRLRRAPVCGTGHRLGPHDDEDPRWMRRR